MGYHVQYPGPHYQKLRKIKGSNVIHAIIALMLLLLIFAAAVIPPSRAMLLEMIIPGDNRVAVEAMDGLIGDMKHGEQFEVAFLVFCDTVLHGETA